MGRFFPSASFNPPLASEQPWLALKMALLNVPTGAGAFVRETSKMSCKTSSVGSCWAGDAQDRTFHRIYQLRAATSNHCSNRSPPCLRPWRPHGEQLRPPQLSAERTPPGGYSLMARTLARMLSLKYSFHHQETLGDPRLMRQAAGRESRGR